MAFAAISLPFLNQRTPYSFRWFGLTSAYGGNFDSKVPKQGGKHLAPQNKYHNYNIYNKMTHERNFFSSPREIHFHCSTSGIGSAA
jgi:hypothetical protein